MGTTSIVWRAKKWLRADRKNKRRMAGWVADAPVTSQIVSPGERGGHA